MSSAESLICTSWNRVFSRLAKLTIARFLQQAFTIIMFMQGVRTYVAGNSPAPDVLVQEGKLHNETWSYYPDDAPLRSLYGGDTRAALVPYLAHASFGDSYKWLLYGDDDTVWFMESVMRLLQDFDPDLPYFITGWSCFSLLLSLLRHVSACQLDCLTPLHAWSYATSLVRLQRVAHT